MESFINITEDSDFTLFNIPFGLFRIGAYTAACTRVGDTVVDLSVCQNYDVFNELKLPEGIFNQNSLNEFIRLGKQLTGEVRNRIQKAMMKGGYLDKEYFKTSPLLYAFDEVEMLLPIQIGDYTDFYSSREHATNVGKMFRDPANALLPNWLHLPVGYHGRASSIVASGTPIKRPSGQIMPEGVDRPVFSATKQMDFELEMAFVIGKDSQLGTPVSTDEAEDYIFGFMLFNDWSARDIQKWEYVPLGPFLAKNFASTVSPWIITLDALDPFRVSGPQQEPEVLPYLKFKGLKNFDIELTVDLIAENGTMQRVSTSNFKYMYWNMCQQLAHHTINGCNVRVGDLMASGTISGPEQTAFGSMLEITWKGTRPVMMKDGTSRNFIENGDTVLMSGKAKKNGISLGFGKCEGKVIG